MMKSKHFRRILTMTAVAAMLVVTAAAAGTITKRTIEANYMGIKLVIDGVEVTPKDAAGNVVEPFTSNGTTYLPVRAVGEALGKEVTWDGDTKTVYIGDTAHLPYQVNHADLYDGSKDTSFSVAGNAYKVGVVLKSYSSKSSYSGNFYDGSAIWNTEGYQTMTFTVGHTGSRQRNATLYIALDGKASGEYQLTWDGSPQTITVPLGGSPNVKLTLVADTVQNNLNYEEYESYGVYDVKLTK